MKRIAVLLVLTLALGACGLVKKTEMPSNDGSGSDLMRSSPCACEQIDYDGKGFEWLG